MENYNGENQFETEQQIGEKFKRPKSYEKKLDRCSGHNIGLIIAVAVLLGFLYVGDRLIKYAFVYGIPIAILIFIIVLLVKKKSGAKPYQINELCQSNEDKLHKEEGFKKTYYLSAFLRGILLIAVVVLIYAIMTKDVNRMYYINEYNKVYKACDKELDAQLIEKTIDEELKKKGVVEYYGGEGFKHSNLWRNECTTEVQWFKFSSEDLAKTYYEEKSAYILKEYRNDELVLDNITSVSSSFNKQLMQGCDSEPYKDMEILIIKDEYCLWVYFRGNEEDVNFASEDLLKRLN